MNMVSAQTLFKLHHYKEIRIDLMNPVTGYDYCSASTNCLESDLLLFDRMEEDESRTNSPNEEGLSSKDIGEEKDEGWLQLGIGGGYMTSREDDKLDHPVQVQPTRQKSELIELDLLSGVSTRHVNEFQAPRPVTDTTTGAATSFSPSLFWQYPRTTSSSSLLPHQPEFTWGYRSNQWNITASASSSSSCSSSSMGLGPYIAPPFQFYPGVDLAGSSSQVRVIDAPRRRHSSIWFSLQASENQTREPYLTQIPKSYLRIKDGRMIVRLLMKYIANKLRLDSESEVEIRCRGQQLEPYLTLQHVRDTIWSSSDVLVTLLPHSSDHLMILHYARSA